VPAREGTLRVLRAANDAGARRVVLTSSFAAIGYSPKPSGLPYDETDWTDPTGDVTPYVKSKTLAERSAWDFVADPSVGLGLSVVKPCRHLRAGPRAGPAHLSRPNPDAYARQTAAAAAGVVRRRRRA